MAERRVEVSSFRLVGTLASVGALAGLAIVIVYQVTRPPILAYKAQVLDSAVQEVLGAPHHYDTLYMVDGRLTQERPSDARDIISVYRGFRQSGDPAGFAIDGAQAGFQDIIRLIFGYEPESGTITGMKVLESRETPGLGDKIEKDVDFVAEFEGARYPLIGVKPGRGEGEDPSQVDMITGATISSRTVIRIINDEIERMRPALEAYAEGAP